jgi:hypothetical protein
MPKVTGTGVVMRARLFHVLAGSLRLSILEALLNSPGLVICAGELGR